MSRSSEKQGHNFACLLKRYLMRIVNYAGRKPTCPLTRTDSPIYKLKFSSKNLNNICHYLKWYLKEF